MVPIKPVWPRMRNKSKLKKHGKQKASIRVREVLTGERVPFQKGCAPRRRAPPHTGKVAFAMKRAARAEGVGGLVSRGRHVFASEVTNPNLGGLTKEKHQSQEKLPPRCWELY